MSSCRERIVLIGETHGKDADLVREVLEGFEDRTLAIEFPRSLQPLVDRFREHGDPSELRAAMREQPEKVTDAALFIIRSRPAVCVDVDELDPSDPQNARESAIAEAVRSIEGKVVAVLGSIHASKDPCITGTRIETVGFRLRDECCSVNASRTHLPGYDLEPFVRASRERKG